MAAAKKQGKTAAAAMAGLLDMLISLNMLPSVIKDDFTAFANKFPGAEVPAGLAWQWFNNRWGNVNMQAMGEIVLGELAATVKAGGGPVVHDDVDVA